MLKDDAKAGKKQQIVQLVNQLSAELQSIFPAWRFALPDQESMQQFKRTWARALIENGITNQNQVDIGLKLARQATSPYLPSVGQFIAWCQSGLAGYGLPEARKAYREACNHAHNPACPWSHVGVYAAAQATGFYELKTKAENITWPVFKENYEAICRQLISGQSLGIALPKPPPPAVQHTPALQATATKNIQHIRTLLARHR